MMPFLLAKAVGGPFSPSSISGLQLWLKADAITGLSDGAPVSTWEDSSGNSRDATQSGSSRPTYKTSIVNGLPVLRFDGTSSYMVTASASYYVQSYFVVMLMKTAGGTAPYCGIIATRTSAALFGASDVQCGFGNSVGGTNLISINSSSGGGNGNTTYVAVDGVSQSTTAFDNYNSGSGIVCSKDVFHYVTDIDTNKKTNGTKIFGIGSDSVTANNRFHNGDIAEVIIYDSNISGTNRTNVENYLKAKYGL